MSITQEQIEKIANSLWKIRPQDTSKLLYSINSILEYVDILNEIDTSWIEWVVNVISKKENILRGDFIKRNIKPIDLLKCSNQKIVANQIAISWIIK